MSQRLLILTVGLGVGLALAGCNGSITVRSKASPGTDGGRPITPPNVPFEPTSPEAYVSKVKDLLTGLPPTDAELTAVKQDPTAMKGLVDGWLNTPQAQAKLILFFEKAFQQTQFTSQDLLDQISAPNIPGGAPVTSLLANMQESFARTVLELMKEGRPFTDVTTTQRYMMTPALQMLWAFIDERQADDNGKLTDQVYRQDHTFTFSVTDDAGTPNAIKSMDPTTEYYALSPSSPNYLQFYSIPQFDQGCPNDTRAFNPGPNASNNLFDLFLGQLRSNGDGCTITAATPLLLDSDFTTWKMVTVRAPQGTEKVTAFYDMPTMRSSSTLLVNIPRLGFFTPSFYTAWQSNTSNLARVTMNQTLIVALGASFDGADSTVPVSETGLDSEHADPSTPCYACHKTLDPMRNFFRRNVTVNYHVQQDPAQTDGGLPQFAFDGVTAQGSTLMDLGNLLNTHPRFAGAWVQKVCYFADSAPCSNDDPAFLKVVSDFQQSHYDFRAMLVELLSSPLITGATETKTADDRGSVISIARYDHFCSAMATRLGMDDPCDLSKVATTLSGNIPSDAFSRGSEVPVLATDPSLFFRATTENLCEQISNFAVGSGNAVPFSVGNVQGALDKMVSTVMALPSTDARATPARQILQTHYTDALGTSGMTPTSALRSTFVLACESPTATSIGL